MHLLTYLAQVRQLPSRSDKPLLHHVFMVRPISPIQPSKKLGMSLKEIVIIGTAPGAAWVARNRNMVAWWKVVVIWLPDMISISSPLPVVERK